MTDLRCLKRSVGHNFSTIHNCLTQGEFFGETAVSMPVKRTASVRAVTQCTLFVLTIDGMGTIRTYFPSVARSILQKICVQIR